MKKDYVPDQATLMADIQRYGGTSGIAEHYGVSIYQVRYQRKKHNLLTRGLQIAMPTREELLDALKELGTGRAVSYKYGVSPSTITRWKKIHKIKIEYRGPRIPSYSKKEIYKQHNTQIIRREIKKGVRRCLKCRDPFYSEDLRLIRLCPKCKASQSRMARVEYYRIATSSALK